MLLWRSVAVLSELAANKEILCFQANRRHAVTELGEFEYVIYANPNAERMQCTKVRSWYREGNPDTASFDRYNWNNMNSCSKYFCESWQDADFVTPVTDWRRRVFLETCGCLRQRPLQLIPVDTDFITRTKPVVLLRQSFRRVN